MSLVYKLLSPSCIKKYFNINKKNNLYFCPKCYESANYDFVQFAILLMKIRRNKCPECKGTVFDEMGQCLTCCSIIE